jgi:hypothetical protein
MTELQGEYKFLQAQPPGGIKGKIKASRRRVAYIFLFFYFYFFFFF